MTTDEMYADLIARCLAGSKVTTRNSVCYRTRCVRYTFTSTPLVGIRRVAWRTCLREWEWFMSGSNDIGDLHESVRPWWEPWARYGVVPFNYSVQFRRAGVGRDTVDQIDYLIDSLTKHPNSRRAVVTTWHAPDMLNLNCPITNCHNTMTQCFVEPDNTLHMKTYQRSADVVCGVPHNWFQQWAFLVWLAHRSGRRAGSLEWEGGDCHVYAAHEDLANRMLNEPAAPSQPELVYEPKGDDREFRAGHFYLYGEYRPAITERAEMIV